ncbi:MAG: 6-bladed beta-propeller [Longimicrobiales bacterium]
MIRCYAIRVVAAGIALASGCSAGEGRTARWEGSVDTLASGQIVVHNTASPLWSAETAWQVVEELRIGSMEGSGPATFGSINTMDVDPAGRLWILDSQAQELRVFDTTGTHVRTIGRRGGGPGEFAQAVQVRMGPDGNVWVMDPQNNRISVFDTAGTYLEGKHAAGGFIIIPWPGGFDDGGRYYTPVPREGPDFRMVLVRLDSALTPLDTLELPDDPITREYFELRSDDGFIRAGIPYQGRLDWRLSPAGTILAMMTDEYRLFELDASGDTLRTITREFTPFPVTDADLEEAREDLKWFIDQGGQVDWSKLPDSKPAAETFYVDDEGNLWVRTVGTREDEGRRVDVFDREGRFLGTIALPFVVSRNPAPIFRDGLMYAVTQDELEVPYVIRARIVKP